jgi:hypothetical protein
MTSRPRKNLQLLITHVQELGKQSFKLIIEEITYV